VIYARSFSKTCRAACASGSSPARQHIANELADIKMLTSITTSQFTERLIYLMLVDGHYPQISRAAARAARRGPRQCRARVRGIGLELFAEPNSGMFVWARFPQVEDALPLAEAAASDGIMLAPGVVFRPHLERSPWMRFNVAICDDPRVQRWLARARLSAEQRNALGHASAYAQIAIGRPHASRSGGSGKGRAKPPCMRAAITAQTSASRRSSGPAPLGGAPFTIAGARPASISSRRP
jgi:hypothetical protein